MHRTLALGLGALATQLVWANYNAYLPLLYGRFTASNTLIGLIMVLDNAFAIALVPYVAALSDRTWTRWGRRTPFLVAGMPLTALGLALVARTTSFGALLAVTVAMNLGLALSAGPLLALMPDVTPEERRARANGLITALAGCGALVAFFVLAPAARGRPLLPFDAGALAALGALAVILATIREPRDAIYRVQLSSGRAAARSGPMAYPQDAVQRAPDSSSRATAGPGNAPYHLQAVRRAPGSLAPAERAQPARQRARWLPGGVAREAVGACTRPVVLLGVLGLCAVAAVNGVQNMFTRYGVHRLGLDPAGAATLLGFFVLTFIAGAVPAGLAGDRLGRLRLLRLGLAGTLGAFLLAQGVRGPAPFAAVLLLGGLAWAVFLVNAYPVLLQVIPPAHVGLFSGLWGATSALGGLLAPPIYGWVVDRWGFDAFFLPGIVFMIVAVACSLALRVAPASSSARAPGPPYGRPY
ncbi:MAG: MFS transporter [Firmicutes bacterium]|nr:MFS transporter [Bacillota bacterium]